jgi:hypothetical protein
VSIDLKVSPTDLQKFTRLESLRAQRTTAQAFKQGKDEAATRQGK